MLIFLVPWKSRAAERKMPNQSSEAKFNISNSSENRKHMTWQFIEKPAILLHVACDKGAGVEHPHLPDTGSHDSNDGENEWVHITA